MALLLLNATLTTVAFGGLATDAQRGVEDLYQSMARTDTSSGMEATDAGMAWCLKILPDPGCVPPGIPKGRHGWWVVLTTAVCLMAMFALAAVVSFGRRVKKQVTNSLSNSSESVSSASFWHDVLKLSVSVSARSCSNKTLQATAEHADVERGIQTLAVAASSPSRKDESSWSVGSSPNQVAFNDITLATCTAANAAPSDGILSAVPCTSPPFDAACSDGTCSP
jgi:hypothetical protein